MGEKYYRRESMKRLIIVVEGKTEEEFVNQVLRPYFISLKIYDVSATKIQTRRGFKGGFVSYEHLKNDITRLLYEPNTFVTTFVDYFRIPTNLPNFDACQKFSNAKDRIICLEEGMKTDIGFGDRFLPYIQQHEFESLLFSKSRSFAAYYDAKIVAAIEQIISQYDTPEDINTNPQKAPSKRLLSLIPKYEKVNDGNLIALETGIETILAQCPRFKVWIETLVEKLKID